MRLGKCGCLVALGLAVLGLIVIGMLTDPSPNPPPANPQPLVTEAKPEPRPASTSPTAADLLARGDAPKTLSEVFIPPADKEEIRLLMEYVLRLYRMPPTDENMLRAGSVLIAFRKQEHIPEMKLLRYMARHPMPNVTFPQAAALCVAAYQVDYPNGGP